MLRSAALALVVMLSACSQSDQSKAAGQNGPSTVTVSGIIAQPITAAGTSIGVYMQLSAQCAGADALEGVSAPAPRKASLVATSDVDVKLVVTPVKSIAVACGMPINLRPMEQHIMVAGLDRAVTIGDRIPLTLHFKRAADVPIVAEVSSLAVLENVDPMGMRKRHGTHHGAGHAPMPGMDMGAGNSR